MSVYKRGSIWWLYIRVAGHPVVRESTGQTDRLKAMDIEQARRKEVLAKVKNLPPPTKHDMTVAEAFERAVRMHYSQQSSMRTVGGILKELTESLGAGTLLKEVNEQRVTDLKSDLLDRGNDPATINRKISVLRKVLNMACYEWRAIDRVPFIKQFKEKEGRLRVITFEEEAQMWKLLWAEAKGCHVVFLQTLLDTGMRLSEGLTLSWADIDLERREIRIKADHAKNGKYRTVPMTDKVHRILDCQNCLLEKQDGPFAHLTYQQVQYNWRLLRKQMGLENDPDFVIHALRHTCASRLVQAGVDLYVVKELLGHSTIKVTERYAHLSKEQVKEAIKKLNRPTTASANTNHS